MYSLSPLQHKKLLASAAIALIVFIVGFYLINKGAFTKETVLLSQELPADDANNGDLDSDGDALPDWKERLYGSDIYNTDSDKDGTEDGEEVRLGRNPAKKAPNDEFSYLKDPNFATSSTDIEGIKKEYFAKFLAERSAEIKETTFRDLIQKEVRPEKLIPNNQLSDLNVNSDNSLEGVRGYLNNFGTIIQKYSVRSHRTEDEILVDLLEKKISAAAKELQLPAITYRNFANDLKLMSVPSSLAQNHLIIVNGYDGMSKALFGLQTILQKPIEGSAAYQSYQKSKFDVTTGYAALVSMVIESKMTFTPEEPGYPFYWNTVTQSDTAGTDTQAP